MTRNAARENIERGPDGRSGAPHADSRRRANRPGGADEDYRPGFMELLLAEGVEPQDARPLSVAITLVPRFTLLAFSGFVDALRIASDIGDRSLRKRCSWTLVGADLQPVASSCGAAMAHWERFGDPERFDYVVVVGGLLDEEPAYDPRLLQYLRRAAEAGKTVVGLCTGVFAMAEAGLMNGYRACVHGYHVPEFRERYPGLDVVSDQIFVVDRDRITCAGGVGSIDVAGHILERNCGPDRARKIVPHLLVDELRPAAHPQLLLLDEFFNVYDPRVRSAVFLMQQHIANPLSVAALARRVGVPPRQLERGFQRAFTVSPSSFFRTMRLRRARWLVLHSELSITQIAVDCGFADTAHLTRSFKRAYGAVPSELRRQSSARRDRKGSGPEPALPASSPFNCADSLF